MNPPFSNGDRHLLKAWDVVAGGGDVVCLLNTETLANPYSETRQLLARLIEDHGTSEALGAVFTEAERPTNVGVSLVRLHKPAKADRLTFEFSSRGRRGPELDETCLPMPSPPATLSATWRPNTKGSKPSTPPTCRPARG
ncbi:hypothetical protein GCM10027594_13610 [Hymenobacter agri]